MLTIRRILLPTDFSAAASDAERRARSLTRLFGADLHVLHVTQGNELSELPRRLLRDENRAAARLFHHVSGWLGLSESGASHPSLRATSRESSRSLDPAGGGPRLVRAIRQASSPHYGILDYADEISADVIVVGTRGQSGTRGPLLGTVADRVVRMAECPVVTVRPDVDTADPSPEAVDASDDPSERLIVVPVDFSEPSHSLVTHAKHWAETFNGSVALIHVIEEPRFPPFYRIDRFRADIPRLATEARSRLHTLAQETDGPDVDVSAHVLVGNAAREIVDYATAQEARMLLIGTHGLSGLREYVLGGVTDEVLRTAPCPVCALKSYGRSLLPTASHAQPEGQEDEQTE